MIPAPYPEALSIAFNRAVVAHFAAVGQADAEEVMIAACTVAASYIASISDPIERGVLVAQAQWMLSRMVAEIVRADAARNAGDAP